ncbi:hypothetical protein V8G54_005671 [Vigna mungo]|uniref:Uncharacterized protein n=1 Tax=Vigna mungo TaxID=3915 RepID=A0AAQ3S7A1_VIGMU
MELSSLHQNVYVTNNPKTYSTAYQGKRKPKRTWKIRFDTRQVPLLQAKGFLLPKFFDDFLIFQLLPYHSSGCSAHDSPILSFELSILLVISLIQPNSPFFTPFHPGGNICLNLCNLDLNNLVVSKFRNILQKK